MGCYFDEEGVVPGCGFNDIRTSALLQRNVQRVSVTRSLVQGRRGLATVISFYLASRSLRMPDVDYDLARTLRNFILYRVKASKLAWH